MRRRRKRWRRPNGRWACRRSTRCARRWSVRWRRCWIDAPRKEEPMTRKLQTRPHAWKLKEPFAIARGVRSEARVIVVELQEAGSVGRGEACGVPYHGETPETMAAQIEQVRAAIEAGCDRRELLHLLP